MSDKANCPKCNRVSRAPGIGKDEWYCHVCRMYFSDEDDGDYSSRDPSARIMREERQRARRMKEVKP